MYILLCYLLIPTHHQLVPFGEENAARVGKMSAADVTPENGVDKEMKDDGEDALKLKRFSLLIIEDFSQPPRATQEAATLLFTPSKNFHFLPVLLLFIFFFLCLKKK